MGCRYGCTVHLPVTPLSWNNCLRVADQLIAALRDGGSGLGSTISGQRRRAIPGTSPHRNRHSPTTIATPMRLRSPAIDDRKGLGERLSEQSRRSLKAGLRSQTTVADHSVRRGREARTTRETSASHLALPLSGHPRTIRKTLEPSTDPPSQLCSRWSRGRVALCPEHR